MKKGVVIGAAIALAAALGFFVQQLLSPRHEVTAKVVTTEASDAPAVSTPATDGAVAAEEAPPKVPETLPAFLLADRDGKKRGLKDWAGKPLMVNFWATWCGPCRREIPLLNQIRKQRSGQHLEIVGIAVDFRDDVLKYAKETTIDYPLLIGEEDGLEAVKAMGMQPAFPFTVFADSKQRVVALKVGELHQDEADLILERVLAIDAGKLPLATAREEITEGLKDIATRRAAQAGAPAKTG